MVTQPRRVLRGVRRASRTTPCSPPPRSGSASGEVARPEGGAHERSRGAHGRRLLDALPGGPDLQRVPVRRAHLAGVCARSGGLPAVGPGRHAHHRGSGAGGRRRAGPRQRVRAEAIAPGRGTAPDGGNAAGGGAGRGAAAETTPRASAVAPPPRIAVVEIARGPAPALVALAHRRARRAQVVFAAAGLVFGVASTVVYQRVSGEASALRTFPVQALLLSWLAVPTVIALGFTDRRTRLTVWAGYLAAVVLLAATGGAARAAAVDFLVGVVAVPGAVRAGHGHADAAGRGLVRRTRARRTRADRRGGVPAADLPPVRAGVRPVRVDPAGVGRRAAGAGRPVRGGGDAALRAQVGERRHPADPAVVVRPGADPGDPARHAGCGGRGVGARPVRG